MPLKWGGADDVTDIATDMATDVESVTEANRDALRGSGTQLYVTLGVLVVGAFLFLVGFATLIVLAIGAIVGMVVS
jgi:hypothetical protein